MEVCNWAFLKSQRFSSLSSLWEAWQHIGRDGAREVAENSKTGPGSREKLWVWNGLFKTSNSIFSDLLPPIIS